jgi:mono/diheme cytochrome c family protein
VKRRAQRWRQLVWQTIAATLLASAMLVALAGFLLWRNGWYNIGAIDQHWQITYKVLEYGLRYSVRHHAREVVTPKFTDAMANRGAQVYARHCVQCHGAPGVAPKMAMLALQPSPGPLVHMARRWQPNELYWLVANGVKMTAMPAWRFRLNDEDLWSVVAFIGELPKLSSADGVALLDQAGRAPDAVEFTQDPLPGPPPGPPQPHADLERGRIAVTQYACQSCHVIPGVPGSTVDVGPSLKHLSRQRYIAGYLPNTEDNMARWLREPDKVKPGTAMPNLQVSKRDARDMARWLLSPHP